jgi:superfamily II helicase
MQSLEASRKQGRHMFQNLFQLKMLVAVVASAAIGAGVYAFTASNTVPSTTAGAGSGVVRVTP